MNLEMSNIEELIVMRKINARYFDIINELLNNVNDNICVKLSSLEDEFKDDKNYSSCLIASYKLKQYLVMMKNAFEQIDYNLVNVINLLNNKE